MEENIELPTLGQVLCIINNHYYVEILRGGNTIILAYSDELYRSLINNKNCIKSLSIDDKVSFILPYPVHTCMINSVYIKIILSEDK